VHFGCRYSLAVHQTADELRAFGMTDKMIADQEWYSFVFFLSIFEIPQKWQFFFSQKGKKKNTYFYIEFLKKWRQIFLKIN
jgi:hypothetical protein